MPSWSEEAAGRPLPWEEAVCAAAGVVRSTVAELGVTTFAFPLCFLCVFWALALIGDEDDAMGSVMVVLSAPGKAILSVTLVLAALFGYPVNGPCMPGHNPLSTHEKAFSRQNILQD